MAKDKNNIKNALVIFVLVLAGLALFGFSARQIDIIAQWGISIIIGMILGVLSGQIVETFTGDILKKISLSFEIRGIDFSITLFVIVAFLVKLIIFGL